MDWNIFIRHWDCMLELSDQLRSTEFSVYHGISDDNQLIHGNVFSEKFRQILMLSAIEFRSVTSELNVLIGNSNTDKFHTVLLNILKKFPKIRETEVLTRFCCFSPLINLDIQGNNDQTKMIGLSWWEAYNAQKHDDKNVFEKATLRNAMDALASVFVVDLYILYVLMGGLEYLREYPSSYFSYKHLSANGTVDYALPDFVECHYAPIARH